MPLAADEFALVVGEHIEPGEVRALGLAQLPGRE
jgi:hypothetical protein